MASNGPIRVLIIDDSALVRMVLKQGLEMDPGIEVVGVASDPYMGRDLIVQTHPDVLTLDVEMPRMDGVEFLRKLMPRFPIPVLMVSALTQKGKRITMEALEAGAVDFVTKPATNVTEGLNLMMQELRTKVKIASTANVSHWKYKRISEPHTQVNTALAESTDKVIAIGASTGGTEALRSILTRLPANSPGIVIVQHMPPGFTKMFSERLNQTCPMVVKEAETGDRVMAGQVLIAPGDRQMRVLRRGGMYQVVCEGTELVAGHCPSVEVLFQSVAKHVGANAIGVILTGMGRDGSQGLLEMRKAGAHTIGQDEASCVVYGMPKEARDIGAVEKETSLHLIPKQIVEFVNQKRG